MTVGDATPNRAVINPGVPDWSGENPGIFLKETPAGAYTTLVSFFRLVHSPAGRGHAAFVLLDPEERGSHPNVCLTDNEPLARYLEEAFLSRFLVFRGLPGLDAMQYHIVERFEASGDTRSRWVERAIGPAMELELVWDHLKEPYFAAIPADRSPTGQEIFALFIEAMAATVRLNGYLAPGNLGIRDFYGRPASSAFLAFGETWVTRPGASSIDTAPGSAR